MTRTKAPWLAALCVGSLGCQAAEPARGAATIAQQYGLADTLETIVPGGKVVEGTLVPIITIDGQRVHLFVPTYQSRDVEAAYLRDERGLHPVRLRSSAGRMAYDFITHY